MVLATKGTKSTNGYPDWKIFRDFWPFCGCSTEQQKVLFESLSFQQRRR
jgi:hypothetical protein